MKPILKNTVVLICVSAMLLLLCGCEYCSTGYWQAKSNSDKVNQLRAGMNKEQVIGIMGEPLKSQAYSKPNIWFYYTQIKWSDATVTRDECTPLFFKDGVLVGWGEQYYKAKVEFRDPREVDEGDSKTAGSDNSSNLIKAFEQQLEGKVEKKLEGKSEKEIMEYIEKSAEKEIDKAKAPQPEKKQEAPAPAPAPVKAPVREAPDKEVPAVRKVQTPPETEKPVQKAPVNAADGKASSSGPAPAIDDETDSRSVSEILNAAEKDSNKNGPPPVPQKK